MKPRLAEGLTDSLPPLDSRLEGSGSQRAGGENDGLPVATASRINVETALGAGWVRNVKEVGASRTDGRGELNA
jgi:hypothetical protein